MFIIYVLLIDTGYQVRGLLLRSRYNTLQQHGQRDDNLNMDCTVSNTSDNHTQDNILTGLSLYEACRTNNVDVVRQALLQGVSVNFSYKKSFTPLHVSAENGHTEIVSLLLENQADVNVMDEWGHTPLHWATDRAHTEIVSLLLKHKADVNVMDVWGYTPLHWATDRAHTEIVSLLLEHEADVNVMDEWGHTLLHRATDRAHTEIVSLLLKHKADVNVKGQWGHTPLHIATDRAHTEIVSLLLEHEADVNVMDECGDTLLHTATERGRTEIFSLLMANNADVNRTDIFGLTPLHLSSKYGHIEIVSLLLANKADINARCLKGFTPLFYAERYGNRRTVDYLLQHGAVLDNLSLTRRIGFWWRKLSLKQSTTTSVSLTLKPDSEDKKSSARTLEKAPTNTEDCLTAAGRDVETTSDPTPSYENFTPNNLSETVSTSESGQALATAIAGRMTQGVTECLKEFPGVYSTCQPDISIQVSSTQQNEAPIMNINVTSVVNINNEIVIQEGKDVKCQNANINTSKFVSVGGAINVVNSSRKASIDNEDIDESSDEAE